MPKTYKNLFPQIIDFDNLLQAYYRARKGKKQTGEMRIFHFNLENNLWDKCVAEDSILAERAYKARLQL